MTGTNERRWFNTDVNGRYINLRLRRYRIEPASIPLLSLVVPFSPPPLRSSSRLPLGIPTPKGEEVSMVCWGGEGG